ncbi:glycosyltransferase family 2 protein [Litchfieldella rifensis]|uniref:Glycosyltransferase family 2 protein n=1 Tax=Litchfieldella rifensis TaxID=762643 RepID=A0ABV7LMJ4_9GAMM
MQKLLVSIVIATYNRARLLGQAIQSIVDQTYRPLETVVVDDGSTDETRNMVLAFERCWSHRDGLFLHYLAQDNGGPATARNRGIQASRGEYLLFLDDDDLMAGDAVDHLVTALRGRSGAAISYGSYANASEEGVPDQAIQQPKPIRSQQELLDNMIRGTWFVPIHGHLFTRQAVERIGEWNPLLPSQEDDEFILRAMLQDASFVPAPQARVFYRQHVGIRRSHPGIAGSWDERGQTQRLQADLAIRELAFRELGQRGQLAQFQDAFAGWYRRLLARYRPLLDKVDLSGNDLIQWVCKSAHTATDRGNEPAQSVKPHRLGSLLPWTPDGPAPTGT